MGYNTMKKEILFQFDIAWQLFEYHCQNLNDDEALWCINENGLQIRKKDTTWIPDWPDTEDYAIGPSSISWIMWHILFWWKSTISASKYNIILNKDDVKWPGDTSRAIIEIRNCHDEWIHFVNSLSEEELSSSTLCRWPFDGQNMYSLLLWLNAELMKNASEIGFARFLYASIKQKSGAE